MYSPVQKILLNAYHMLDSMTGAGCIVGREGPRSTLRGCRGAERVVRGQRTGAGKGRLPGHDLEGRRQRQARVSAEGKPPSAKRPVGTSCP